MPLPVADEVANLRPQLPINSPFDGLPWSGESRNVQKDATEWLWATTDDDLTVEVSLHFPDLSNTQVRGPGSEVTIDRNPSLLYRGCATTAPTPPTPEPADVIDNDGTYLVGTDIQPGRWRSDGGTDGMDCYWKRLSSLNGGIDDIIQNNLSGGPQVVQIQPSDKAFVTAHCQVWHKSSQ